MPGFIECIAGIYPVFITRQLLLAPKLLVRYADAPMAIFEANPEQPLEAVDLGSVAGHFAVFQLGGPRFVIIHFLPSRFTFVQIGRAHV